MWLLCSPPLVLEYKGKPKRCIGLIWSECSIFRVTLTSWDGNLLLGPVYLQISLRLLFPRGHNPFSSLYSFNYQNAYLSQRLNTHGISYIVSIIFNLLQYEGLTSSHTFSYPVLLGPDLWYQREEFTPETLLFMLPFICVESSIILTANLNLLSSPGLFW